ncbi:MAG: TolB family protein, partial [Bryobacteraceae bacterium]
MDAGPASGLGHLLFTRDGTLLAQPFDTSRLQIAGDPVPVAQPIGSDGRNLGLLSVSENGVLVYQARDAIARTEMVWRDRAGKRLGAIESGSVNPYNAALAPDGRRIAFGGCDLASSAFDVWLHDAGRGGGTRLTFEPSVESLPVWSPDGARVVFYSTRGGTWN